MKDDAVATASFKGSVTQGCSLFPLKIALQLKDPAPRAEDFLRLTCLLVDRLSCNELIEIVGKRLQLGLCFRRPLRLDESELDMQLKGPVASLLKRDY